MPCDAVLVARATIKVDNSRMLANEKALEALRMLLAKALDATVTLSRSGDRAVLSVGYNTTATFTSAAINVTGYDDAEVRRVKAALQPLAIKMAVMAQNAALIAAVQERYANVNVTTSGTKTVVSIPL